MLMIVVAVIGILAAIGYPSYMDQVRRSNRAEGKSALMNAAALQEKFFSNRNTYTTSMVDLGLGSTAASYSTEKGYYAISAAACAGGTIATCYLLTAQKQGGQNGDTKCATMTLTNTGVKGGSGAQCDCATSATCW
jgi:type IV pilus assembly protein PilE